MRSFKRRTPQIYSVATGTGSFIPPDIIPNSRFADNLFLNENGTKVETPGSEVINKFEEITDISQRHVAKPDLNTSDLATLAGREALNHAGFDPEHLDYIIVAHNLGDLSYGGRYPDILPTLASRVKKNLGIQNHRTVAYDLTFGCPGWTQAMIQANYFLRSGDAQSALVIGADTLSRAMDPHDRDAMIFADGAAAVLLQAVESDEPVGILRHSVRSDTAEHYDLLKMGPSYNREIDPDERYLKMLGRKVYNYSLTNVPLVAKECLELNGLQLSDVRKILIHQANAKMDEAILKRLFRLYGDKKPDPKVMPMTIRTLGNTSVASVPTLFDLIVKNRMDGHALYPGDYVMMTSVGAGMNINAFIYRMPLA